MCHDYHYLMELSVNRCAAHTEVYKTGCMHMADVLIIHNQSIYVCGKRLCG